MSDLGLHEILIKISLIESSIEFNGMQCSWTKKLENLASSFKCQVLVIHEPAQSKKLLSTFKIPVRKSRLDAIDAKMK